MSECDENGYSVCLSSHDMMATIRTGYASSRVTLSLQHEGPLQLVQHVAGPHQAHSFLLPYLLLAAGLLCH
jgi:hypothetical protein